MTMTKGEFIIAIKLKFGKDISYNKYVSTNDGCFYDIKYLDDKGIFTSTFQPLRHVLLPYGYVFDKIISIDRITITIDT